MGLMITHRTAHVPHPRVGVQLLVLCRVSTVLLYLTPKKEELKAHGRPDTYHIWVIEAGPSLLMVRRVKGETIVSVAMGTQRCPSDPSSNS